MNIMASAALSLSSSWFPINGTLVCKTMVLSLGHSVWQAGLLAIILSLLMRSGGLRLSRQYQLAMTILLLIGVLPAANFFWLYPNAQPTVVALPFHNVSDYSGLMGRSVNQPVASDARGNSNVEQAFPAEHSNREIASLPSESRLAPPSSPPIWSWNNFYHLIMIVYATGVLVMAWRLLRGIAGHRTVHHLAAHITQQLPDGVEQQAWSRLTQAAKRAADQLGWQGKLRLSLISGPLTAVVVGCLRPVVLVNLTLVTGLTPRQLEQVIAHELVHLIRWDPIALLLQRLVEVTQFFNPSVWLISRQVCALREMCCDQHVAQHYGAVEYAQTLVECATQEHQTRHPLALAVVGGQVSRMRHRISVLLDLPEKKPPLIDWSRLIAWSRSHWRSRPGLIGALRVGCLGFGLTATVWVAVTEFKQDTIQPKLATPEWPWRLTEDETMDRTRMAFQSRRLSLSDELPKSLKIEAPVNLPDCKFAQWQFGDHRSQSVTLMVLVRDGRPDRVYLDRNRDLKIDESERLSQLPNEDRIWLTDLPLETTQGEQVVAADRPLAIDFTTDLQFARIATRGFAEGTIAIGDKSYLCRRVDNDGDGIPLGPRDALWIDLDGDQNFDPITERFSYGPWIEIEGVKYGLQSDVLGQALKLAPAPALGNVQFLAELADPNGRIVDLQGTFRDRYGNFVPVRMDRLTVDVLPGEYCIESLTLSVVDGAGETWFVSMSRGFETEWFEVQSEQTTEIDLLSRPKLHAVSEVVMVFPGHTEAGFRPYLIGPSGLIVTDFKKRHTETVQMQLKLSRPDGLPVDGRSTNACSGFT